MTPPLLRWTGSLSRLDSSSLDSLLARGGVIAADDAGDSLQSRVADLIRRVRTMGDSALLAMACELDRVQLESLEVPRAARRRALDALAPELRRALERAADNIATAHRALLPAAVETEPEPGILIGRRPDPLTRVGVYAPGGTAAYPSSVLMGAVPARVAGVAEVVLCSPPGADGLPSAVVLAAAELAGVDRVFAIGGAGAIAAMAYGTETVPRADRIVGPGNAWVAEAKLQVSRTVPIDSPAGPSELLIIGDQSADAATLAREALAQAEHDADAAIVVIVVGEQLAAGVISSMADLLPAQPRCSTIAAALASRGAVLTADSLHDATEFANEYAAEHLMLAVGDPEELLTRVRSAGTVFLGERTSVAFGDYLTGANHVLPTGGLARSWSGLSTQDFMRWTTWQRVRPDAAARLAGDVALMAESEGLPAHAAAARAWDRDGVASDRAGASDVDLVDLGDNTNLWGMPPAARRALETAIRAGERASLSRYPAIQAAPLVDRMARYLGVGADQIVTGCGSDDVIDSAMRALAAPGEAVAYFEPTFSMIPVFARLNRLVPVPLRPTGDADADIDALVATGAAIIYLCSPNNPTGAVLTPEVIERIVARAPGHVILDEAYAEYSRSSGCSLLATSPRLLITRTMSKAFGLAGLRIGYAAGAPDSIAAVARSRGPYKVNALAERVAAAALAEDIAWVDEHVAEVALLRSRLTNRLVALGLAPLPSEANFVLVPVPRAGDVAARMRTRGVAVRSFSALPVVGDALRVTVGPWQMLGRCLAALQEARA